MDHPKRLYDLVFAPSFSSAKPPVDVMGKEGWGDRGALNNIQIGFDSSVLFLAIYPNQGIDHPPALMI